MLSKEALEWLHSHNQKPTQIERDGNLHIVVGDKVHQVSKQPFVARPAATTLRGFLDLVKLESQRADFEMAVHVTSPTMVSLIGRDEHSRVVIMAKADCGNMTSWREDEVTSENFGQSDFMCWLQSCFVKTDDLDKLAKFISDIAIEEESHLKDDGISQSVMSRKGVANRAMLPAPVDLKLKPYRTFIELPQPESEFALRMQGSRENLLLRLVLRDGGAWVGVAKNTIMDHIKTSGIDLPVIQ